MRILSLVFLMFIAGSATQPTLASAQSEPPETAPSPEETGEAAGPTRDLDAGPTADLDTTVPPSANRPDDPPAATLFARGIESFRKGELDKSRAFFAKVVQKEANNPTALFNFGLVQFELGRKGEALALWRKAAAVQPGWPPAVQAIEWAVEKLDRPEIAHESEPWERLHDTLLAPFSMTSFLLLTALFLLACGWSTLSFYGERRRARLEGHAARRSPAWAIAFSFGLVLSLSLTLSKARDLNQIRGTILPEKVSVRSHADASATVLFELYEGLEVILRSSHGPWAQVTYPGGPTGWIPRNSLFTVQDRTDDFREFQALTGPANGAAKEKDPAAPHGPRDTGTGETNAKDAAS